MTWKRSGIVATLRSPVLRCFPYDGRRANRSEQMARIDVPMAFRARPPRGCVVVHARVGIGNLAVRQSLLLLLSSPN